MSQWFDGIRYNMQQHLSKVYKDAKAKAPPEEFKEFETWFWKIRPLLTIDWSVRSTSSQSETTGPNIHISQSINTDINDS